MAVHPEAPGTERSRAAHDFSIDYEEGFFASEEPHMKPFVDLANELVRVVVVMEGELSLVVGDPRGIELDWMSHTYRCFIAESLKQYIGGEHTQHKLAALSRGLGHDETPPQTRLFVCGRQTEKLRAQLNQFLGGDLSAASVKRAVPPYNVKKEQGGHLLARWNSTRLCLALA